MAETYTVSKFEDTWEARSISLNEGDVGIFNLDGNDHKIKTNLYINGFGNTWWGLVAGVSGNYILPLSHQFAHGIFDVAGLYWSAFNYFFVDIKSTSTINEGWTSVEVNGFIFNREDSSVFYTSGSTQYWQFSNVVNNPFEETIGTIATVNWTV